MSKITAGAVSALALFSMAACERPSQQDVPALPQTGPALSEPVVVPQAPVIEGRVPYVCVEDDKKGLLEEWLPSQARATQIDNSTPSHKVSAGRISRGESFASLMDGFWSTMDKQSAQQPPKNIRDMMNLMESAFLAGQAKTETELRAKKAEVTFYIGAFGTTRTNGEHVKLDFTAAELKEKPLMERPEVVALFTNPDTSQYKYDAGVEVGLRFSGVGSYHIITLADEVARYVDAKPESDLKAFLGNQETDDYGFGEPKSYWDELNVKDDVACPKLAP